MHYLKNPVILFSPVFLISVLFYIPNSGGSTFSLPYNSFTLLALGLSVFVTLHYRTKKHHTIVFDKFLFLIITCSLALFIPLSWSKSAQLYSALPRLTTIIFGAFLYFSLLQINYRRYFLKYILYIICLSTVISSLFSLYQNYLMNTNSYFTIAIEYGRPIGIFQQVNVLSSYTATGLAISFFLLWDKNKKPIVYLLLFSIFLNSWVLFLTQSRLGYLSFLIISLYYTLRFLKSRKSKLLITTLVIITVSFSLAKLLPYSIGNEYVTKKNILSSPNIRLQIYTDSISIFSEKPFLGHGYGSYHRLITDYSADKAESRGNVNIGKTVEHPHNELILWLVEGGIFSVIIILMPIIYLTLKLQKSSNKKKSGLLLLITPILLHNLTELPFYQSFLHFITFIFLFYYILQSCDKNELTIIHSKSTLKISNLIIFIGILLFTTTSIQSIVLLRRYIYEEHYNHILLSKLTNPFIDFKFRQIQINTLKLEIAINSNDYTTVRNFISWSDNFLQAYPSDYVLFERIRAFRFLGMVEKEKSELIHAKKLYPQNSSWDSQIWTPISN